MFILYVMLSSGVLFTQTLDNVGDTSCVRVAQELRSDPKVANAFCLVTDPDDSDNTKIARVLKDLEAKPTPENKDGQTSH